MKARKFFVLPAICCALALTLGVCGEEKQENAKAKAEAEEKAKLIFSKIRILHPFPGHKKGVRLHP